MQFHTLCIGTHKSCCADITVVMPLRMPLALSQISTSLASKSVSGVLHSWPTTPCKSVAHVSSLSLLSASCRLRRYEYVRFSSLGAQLGSGGTRSRPSVVAATTGIPPQAIPDEKVDEETKFWEQIQTHQRSVARLSNAEEARTLLARSSTATLSTVSQKYDGFPLGSMVLYATDDFGRPILAISSLSPHTKDLETNPKCSLLVARDSSDISDTVVTIIGEAETVSEAEWEGARSTYLRKHPDAFWVDFGDFRLVRITPKKVRYLAGSATAFVTFGEIEGKEYQAATVDPIAQFTAPIAGHMNRDHADQVKEIAERSLGVEIDNAKIMQVDRLGFNIQTAHDGRPLKLRIPFPRPAQDRKDVKILIVELLGGSTPA